MRDAIASERLTSSPRITSVYAFCGNSGFFEFAGGGSLADRLQAHYAAKYYMDDAENEDRNNDILSQYEKLNLAYQVAAGLADFHDADAMRNENGRITSAAMVHADITTDQYVNIDGVFKLNDFNRCRFMLRRRDSAARVGGDGEPCGFFVGNNPAKNRSPEEYAYTVETEFVDIYSMGNIIYSILTDKDPWEETPEKRAQKLVMEGKRPNVPERVKSSKDFVDVALRAMMWKCWEQTPNNRPRARKVADFFAKKLSDFQAK